MLSGCVGEVAGFRCAQVGSGPLELWVDVVLVMWGGAFPRHHILAMKGCNTAGASSSNVHSVQTLFAL